MAKGDRRYIFLGIILGTTVSGLCLTYGKWEYLSLQHSTEFKTALDAPINTEQTSIFAKPAYLKVIEYSRWGATVLMQETAGGQQVMLYFTRNKNDQWLLVKWNWCSIANGCPRGCAFPWYGAIESLFCRRLSAT